MTLRQQLSQGVPIRSGWSLAGVLRQLPRQECDLCACASEERPAGRDRPRAVRGQARGGAWQEDGFGFAATFQ